MRNIPRLISSATIIALLGPLSAHAVPPPGADAADTVFSSTPVAVAVREPPASPANPGADLDKTVQQLQKRLDAIEARLGSSSRPPSITYNMERRLADLEKRVQQLEQQTTRLQQLDQRVRRLEMK